MTLTTFVPSSAYPQALSSCTLNPVRRTSLTMIPPDGIQQYRQAPDQVQTVVWDCQVWDMGNSEVPVSAVRSVKQAVGEVSPGM